ncbi:MAG: DUF4099 domain-containing protein [Bacteroides sp.]|nr:DUF4099 domain-containing protein [Bacteroides sp.]MCM1531477.1 DUF4099 domain-containing protein [Ruminococcus flavefaciens]MCM1554361.1 DUF4099 domain-containing protein [Bacteroides sp.]
MKEEQEQNIPQAEPVSEQAPVEAAPEQTPEVDASQALKGEKAANANLKESIMPTVNKPQIDPNKTEGGVLLDTIISNLYSAYQRRKQKRESIAANEKIGEQGKEPINPEEFKKLMQMLEKEGVNLEQLHKNGDMDRLLQGRITKEVYTRTPEGSWLPRSGALFIGGDNQIHQALIRQEKAMEKDLTAKENEQLRKEGEVLKGDTLIKRNPKTNRVQRIPASKAARQRSQKQVNKRTVAPKKKMVKRGL